MAGQPLASRVSTRAPYVFAEGGDARVAVVDYGTKRSILRRLAATGVVGDGLPARRRRRHARRLRRRRALERPRRSGAARRGDGDRPRAARPGAGARDLPRPPAARARDRASRRSSCRSGTAARTIRCVERATGRVLVTSQNHGFAVEPGDGRAATHESLYDGTVEGLAYPELRARSVQFHPEAGPGPHDAWPIMRRMGRRRCAVAAA